MRGFAYVGVLLLVAVLGLTAAVGLRLGATVHRRAAEQALLDTGEAFGLALQSYARATPAGQPDAPMSLDELVRDPRFPGVVRHLRRVFADPLTGRTEWGLERNPDDCRIAAVFSLSEDRPIRQQGLDERRFAGFARQPSYQQWRFRRPAEAALRVAAATRGGGVEGAWLGVTDDERPPPVQLGRQGVSCDAALPAAGPTQIR